MQNKKIITELLTLVAMILQPRDLISTLFMIYSLSLQDPHKFWYRIVDHHHYLAIAISPQCC